MAPQVKSRLNFNPQSSPLPYALEQYTYYTTAHRGQGSTMGRVLEGSDKAMCMVKWSDFQKRNLAIYNQSYRTFYFLFYFGVYTPSKNSFLTRQIKQNPNLIDSKMFRIALFILIKRKNRTQPKYATKGEGRTTKQDTMRLLIMTNCRLNFFKAWK